MNTPTTLREIHERSKARHYEYRVKSYDLPECGLCCMRWPCADYSDAVAAIALLDASNEVSQQSIPVGVPTPGRYRLVFDPTADDDPLTREQRWAEAIIEGRY